MCGILAFFDPQGHYQGTQEQLKEHLMKLIRRQKSRGPDGEGFHGTNRWGLAHVRLAIMDPEHGW